jgi:hypothetical protein
MSRAVPEQARGLAAALEVRLRAMLSSRPNWPTHSGGSSAPTIACGQACIPTASP